MKNRIEEELRRKELENEIGKDLKLEYSKLDYQERLHEGKNKHVVTAIYFFGTLFFCYVFYFLTRIIFNVLFGQALGFFDVDLSFLAIPIHAAFFIIAAISAVKKKSVLDNIIHRII